MKINGCRETDDDGDRSDDDGGGGSGVFAQYPTASCNNCDIMAAMAGLSLWYRSTTIPTSCGLRGCADGGARQLGDRQTGFGSVLT